MRLARASSMPLSAFDTLAIALGAGLFVVSLIDFWRGRYRRAIAVGVLRLVLAACVTIRLDIPIAVGSVMQSYAHEEMRTAVTTEQKIYASMVVLTVVDRSPLVSLLAMSPSRLVSERRCGLFVTEYNEHVVRKLSLIKPFFVKHLAACRAARISRSPSEEAIRST